MGKRVSFLDNKKTEGCTYMYSLFMAPRLCIPYDLPELSKITDSFSSLLLVALGYYLTSVIYLIKYSVKDVCLLKIVLLLSK